MKNKRYKLWAVCLSAAAILSACVNEDDLEQNDPNVDTTANFWKTDSDAIKGLNAAYAALLTDGTYMRSSPLLLDLKGDDTVSNSPWGAMYNVGRFNSNPTDPAIYGWAFETYYIGINRCNQILENVPNIEMDGELKNRILGQAYFLRGLYEFHAVNMFKNVPLPESSTQLYHPQASQADGWARVIADMETAADMLPPSYAGVSGPDANQPGRATKGAALGYLAKAHLFNKHFDEARDIFQSIINMGVYNLVSNYRDNFTDINENNSESLFEVQFSREAGGVDLGWGGIPAASWGKTSARAITYAPRAFGWTDVQPSQALFNDYQLETTTSGDLDPRLRATIFYNYPGATLYGQDFATFYASNPADLNALFCRKYQNSDGNFANEYDWRSGINERLLRYADVLLMYAECLNETGNTAGAYPYIQMVRDRVGLPDLATVHPGMTQQQMRDQIAHERFLEFPLEGHRFDDIRRWGWLEDPAKLAWLKSRDAEFDSFAPGREYFPIPQLEMDNNPGMVQNPSY